MIWGILALVVIGGVFLAQWGAGKVAAEKLKRAEDDLEAATRIAEANTRAPTDRQSVLDRLRDDKRQL